MGDFETLYRLDQACFDGDIAYSRRELREFLSLSTAQAIAAEDPESAALVGFVVGYVSIHRRGQVVTLDVAREHRRQGIGKALLEALLARFSAAFVDQVRLEVDVENQAAVAFYERFGFARVRRLADYYGPNRPAWEMGLEIPNPGLRSGKPNAPS